MKRTLTRKIHPPQPLKNNHHLLMPPLLLRSRPNSLQIIPSLSIRVILRRKSTISEKLRKHSLQTPSVLEGWLNVPRLRDSEVDCVQTGNGIWGFVENRDDFGFR